MPHNLNYTKAFACLKYRIIIIETALIFQHNPTMTSISKGIRLLIFSIIILYSFNLFAQTSTISKDSLLAPPGLKTERAEEDYSHLKDKSTNPYQKGFADALKYISLNASKTAYLTLGGGYRARLEHTSNQNWTPIDITSYTQRISFHTNWVLGKYIRIFGEVYHGYFSEGETFSQSDELDLHQGFIEFIVPIAEDKKLSIRVGRQEKEYGASRLVGLREGPNIRRSFDLGSLTYLSEKAKIQILYGKEVSPQFGVLDNESGIFDSDASNASIWGIYSRFPIKNIGGENELYYLGFQSPFSIFSDLMGKETRHTLGLRRFGKIGKKASYNTEIFFQFGELADNDIRAFNFEADWKQGVSNAKWKPTIGLKIDWSSGDRELADGKLNTFNPMFVNPAIYSLAGVNTPVNLTSIHPSFTCFPLKGLYIYIDYAFFYRTSSDDGLYSPPRFLDRPAGGIDNNHIGDVIGLTANYTINRNLSINVLSSYFIPGGFVEASGDSESIFYIAPTIDFKF